MLDLTSLDVNASILLNNNLVKTTGRITKPIRLVGVRGVVISMIMDQDGQYFIERHMPDDTWEVFANGCMTANEMQVADIDFYVHVLRVRLVPVADATATADAYGYPAKYVKQVNNCQ